MSEASLKIYSKKFHRRKKSYKFGTTSGWVNNDRIVIFRWTIPLRESDSTVKGVKETLKNLFNLWRSLESGQHQKKTTALRLIFFHQNGEIKSVKIFEWIRWPALFIQTLLKSLWNRQKNSWKMGDKQDIFTWSKQLAPKQVKTLQQKIFNWMIGNKHNILYLAERQLRPEKLIIIKAF